MRRKNIAKAAGFIVVFLVLFAVASKLVTAPEYLDYQYVAGFYEEPADSLDAVYIGSSGAFTTCVSPIVWGRSGVAVWDYTTNSQPLAAAKGIIEEARRKQPNALFIVFTGTPSMPTIEKIHKLTDYMPLSYAKLKLIHELCEVGDIPMGSRAELYLPMIRYHSRWNNLKKNDFRYELVVDKTCSDKSLFLKTVKDISQDVRVVEEREELPPALNNSLLDLLSYCKQEDINVLFVGPVAALVEEKAAQRNYIKDLCQSWGFPFLDQASLREEFGLDMQQDYYDTGHANIHGALKISAYLSAYLSEHYGFTDKRGDPAYADWDEAYENYADVVAPYVLDVEWDGEPRDAALAAPELAEPEADETKVELSWGGVDGADGYRIYRKSDGAWAPLATVGADVLCYTDEPQEDGTYTYTVIGYRADGNDVCWGRYDYIGVSVEVTAQEG